jgi:hypothetical protein
MKPHARSATEHPDQSAGRITFRLRIGVTGHDNLSDRERLDERVRGELGRLIGWLDAGGSTTIELAVISQLADGADRLVVAAVRGAAEKRGRHARLEVVLPMQRDVYARAQEFGTDSRREFDELLHQASLVSVSEPRYAGDGHSGAAAHAYEAARRRLIASCDIMLALWDGKQAGGRGGTAETRPADAPAGKPRVWIPTDPAETLLAAASAGKPCIWIPTDPAEAVVDNFAPRKGDDFYFPHLSAYHFYQMVARRAAVPADGASQPLDPEDLPRDTLRPLRESLERLERYNDERLPPKFGLCLRDYEKSGEEEENWIAPYFLRASMLAAEYQRRFVWSARSITLLAIVAAGVLGVHLSLNSNPAWDWAEVGSLVALTAIFLVLHRRKFHDRWISYRSLAERMRSARFLLPAGVDFPLFTPTVTAYIERHPADWIQRAFDEFWQDQRRRRRESLRKRESQRGRERAPETHDDALKQRLADTWIGSQIDYHKERTSEHLLWQRIMLITILVLFAAAVIAAILDASEVNKSVTGFLSVLLPAAAASLGALLTIRQHQQLAERSHQVSEGLEQVQRDIQTAGDRRMILSAAARAARIMAEENEDWLGALWFLDVEHPG